MLPESWACPDGQALFLSGLTKPDGQRRKKTPKPCGRVVIWRIIMHNWESVFGCSPFTFAGQSVWIVLFLYIRRQIMIFHAMTERYEEITVCGKPALFTSIRIKRDTVPDGLYAYDVRHDDECRGIPCEIAPFVHSK